MRKDNDMWVNKLNVEIFMLDPYNFDGQHEIILNYVDQQLRSKNLPATNTCVPIAIGTSAGILKITQKSPIGAFRLPPLTDPSKYLNLVIKRATGQREFSKWEYKPTPNDPLLVDDVQIRNAKLLKTYLTEPTLQRISPLVFMDGAPGTGKSMVIDYILSQVKDQFSILKQISFTSQFIGETASQIVEVTKEVIKRKPCILILEEADGVFMSRWMQDSCSSTTHHIEELMSTMLQCIDMMAKEEGVYIIATTNLNVEDKNVIDPAILSRIGLRLSFRAPTEETVQKVTKELCERKNVSYEMTKIALSEIVGTRKPSYRDIHAAISRAFIMEKAGIEVPEKKKVKKESLAYIQ